MKQSTLRGAMVAVAVMGLIVGLMGCGGGEGGTEPPVNVGTVSGRVQVMGLDSMQGFGGVRVELQTTATPAQTVARGMTDENGNFRLTNVPPGTYVIVLTPPAGSGYVQWPRGVQVNVVAGQETAVGTLTLVHESDLPPSPPTSS